MLNDNQMIPKNTFVKAYRRDIFGPLLKLPSTRMKLFMVMLAGANYYSEQWKYGDNTYHCEPGQFITSYQKLADACISKDVTRKVVINSCKDLIKLNMITVESKYKTNIKITIVNYNGAQFGAQLRAQFENPETTDTIEEIDTEDKNGAQFGAQFGATNKECLKNDKEKGEGSKKTAPSPSHIKIIKSYYQMYQEYTGKAAKVNFGRDTQTIDKYLTIDDNDNNPDKVIIKLKAWFETADSWTIEKLFPLGIFCSQYDEINNLTTVTEKEVYDTFSDIKCNKCGVELKTNRKGEPDPAHRCKYEGYCSECNCGWFWYEGEPEHNHDCDVYQRRIKED